MMQSTMQDFPLNVGMIFRHGRALHGESEFVTFEGDDEPPGLVRRGRRPRRTPRGGPAPPRHRSPATASARSCGTPRSTSRRTSRCPSMGAVLHTLNIRLFPEQLAYVVNHAEDQRDHRRRLARARCSPRSPPSSTTVERYVVVGDGDASRARSAARDCAEFVRYDELLAAAEPAAFDWPEIDERPAAAMCYTSGTTGNPKGVVYSHRSTFLHSHRGIHDRIAVSLYTSATASSRSCRCSTPTRGACPYAALMAGADSAHARPVPAGRAADAHVHREERPTTLGRGAHDLGRHPALRRRARHRPLVDSHRIVCGGSAVPRSLMEAFQERYGVRIVQGWGMTETSPLAAVSLPPRGVELGTDEEMDWRARTGRVVAGVELRIVDDDGNAAAVGRRSGRRDPGARAVDHRLVLRRSVAREVRRRLAAHRRRRPGHAATATSRSPTAPRTSSSRAASGSARSSSRTT